MPVTDHWREPIPTFDPSRQNQVGFDRRSPIPAQVQRHGFEPVEPEEVSAEAMEGAWVIGFRRGRMTYPNTTNGTRIDADQSIDPSNSATVGNNGSR